MPTTTKIHVKASTNYGLYFTSLSANKYGSVPSGTGTGQFGMMVDKTSSFIKATFPLNPDNVRVESTYKKISGSTSPGELSIGTDANTIAANAQNWVVSQGLSEYMGIGIGPRNLGKQSDYFTYHLKPGRGGVSFIATPHGVIAFK